MTVKKFVLSAVLLGGILAACILLSTPAKAQQVTSLTDPSRLSVGARIYRSFDEKPGIAGSFSSGWWAGASGSWELTSPHDPSVKLPVSVIGAFDVGIPAGDQKQTFRGYLGLGFLLKRNGQ